MKEHFSFFLNAVFYSHVAQEPWMGQQQGTAGRVMYLEVTSRGRARLGNVHCREGGESCGLSSYLRLHI